MPCFPLYCNYFCPRYTPLTIRKAPRGISVIKPSCVPRWNWSFSPRFLSWPHIARGATALSTCQTTPLPDSHWAGSVLGSSPYQTSSSGPAALAHNRCPVNWDLSSPPGRGGTGLEQGRRQREQGCTGECIELKVVERWTKRGKPTLCSPLAWRGDGDEILCLASGCACTMAPACSPGQHLPCASLGPFSAFLIAKPYGSQFRQMVSWDFLSYNHDDNWFVYIHST